MTAVDTALADELIASHLDVTRIAAGLQARVLDILDRLQRELVARLADPSRELTDFTKARLQALLREVTSVVDNYYQRAQGELDLTLNSISQTLSTHVADLLDAHVTATVGAATLPSETFMARLAANSLVMGGPAAEWWQRLSLDAAFKLNNAIRQGIVQGETNAQIIARVTGTRTSPGVMDIARTNAAAVVQTATMTVANDARLATFQKNADVVTALKWLATIDGHTCERCIARSDLTWSNDDAHTPIDHAIPFENPPIHFNDRCVLVPVTATFAELGIDLPEPKPGQRASSEGPVSSTTSFADWLSRRSVAQQDEQLGPGRAQLWRDGKITLQQLLNVDGNPLSVAQLQRKYGG